MSVYGDEFMIGEGNLMGDGFITDGDLEAMFGDRQPKVPIDEGRIETILSVMKGMNADQAIAHLEAAETVIRGRLRAARNKAEEDLRL